MKFGVNRTFPVLKAEGGYNNKIFQRYRFAVGHEWTIFTLTWIFFLICIMFNFGKSIHNLLNFFLLFLFKWNEFTKFIKFFGIYIYFLLFVTLERFVYQEDHQVWNHKFSVGLKLKLPSFGGSFEEAVEQYH